MNSNIVYYVFEYLLPLQLGQQLATSSSRDMETNYVPEERQQSSNNASGSAADRSHEEGSNEVLLPVSKAALNAGPRVRINGKRKRPAPR